MLRACIAAGVELLQKKKKLKKKRNFCSTLQSGHFANSAMETRFLDVPNSIGRYYWKTARVKRGVQRRPDIHTRSFRSD
ncbi:hypothetical protein PUN28_010752 [Cardiocondyla obscurior]|uniref:Uncharacterized protein n=1 Tax=Cardiocondyla obscurior TaxID=286306 RepID=A0AAW2FKX3_9HYME